MRISGEHFVLLADRANLKKDAISDLLGETFISMKPADKFRDTFKMILGCDIEVAHYWLEFDTDEKEAWS